LVWVLRKLRYLVESSKQRVTIFTDYSTTVAIIKQISLTTSSIDKLNTRLIRASQYISQYTNELDIRYKPRKVNLIPNALSRLLYNRNDSTISGELEALVEEGYPADLDLNAYVITTAKLSKELIDSFV